jgi:hypothetical protein
MHCFSLVYMFGRIFLIRESKERKESRACLYLPFFPSSSMSSGGFFHRPRTHTTARLKRTIGKFQCPKPVSAVQPPKELIGLQINQYELEETYTQSTMGFPASPRDTAAKERLKKADSNTEQTPLSSTPGPDHTEAITVTHTTPETESSYGNVPSDGIRNKRAAETDDKENQPKTSRHFSPPKVVAASKQISKEMSTQTNPISGPLNKRLRVASPGFDDEGMFSQFSQLTQDEITHTVLYARDNHEWKTEITDNNTKSSDGIQLGMPSSLPVDLNSLWEGNTETKIEHTCEYDGDKQDSKIENQWKIINEILTFEEISFCLSYKKYTVLKNLLLFRQRDERAGVFRLGPATYNKLKASAMHVQVTLSQDVCHYSMLTKLKSEGFTGFN